MKLSLQHALIAAILATTPALAETGYITVQVQDAQRRPIRAIEIGVEGIGGSRLSGDDGKAQLALAKSTAPNDWITLQILHSPAGKDFVIVSPWGLPRPGSILRRKAGKFHPRRRRRTRRPRRSRKRLRRHRARRQNQHRQNAKDREPAGASTQSPTGLATIAGQYGLSTIEVDTAIRSWGKKTTDHYEAGMAALYENNYSGASTALTGALEQRQQKTRIWPKPRARRPEERSRRRPLPRHCPLPARPIRPGSRRLPHLPLLPSQRPARTRQPRRQPRLCRQLPAG